MFNKILEAEIEWCEKNDGAMPSEYRKGFVAGLKQAVYLINAAKKRMVWQDGVMVDDDDLLVRDAQLRIGADEAGHTCPSCDGRGYWADGSGNALKCGACDGTGQV
jgi:hypothetical protein